MLYFSEPRLLCTIRYKPAGLWPCTLPFPSAPGTCRRDALVVHPLRGLTMGKRKDKEIGWITRRYNEILGLFHEKRCSILIAAKHFHFQFLQNWNNQVNLAIGARSLARRTFADSLTVLGLHTKTTAAAATTTTYLLNGAESFLRS